MGSIASAWRNGYRVRRGNERRVGVVRQLVFEFKYYLNSFCFRLLRDYMSHGLL